MTFIQKLRTAQRRNNSLLCIGLDTDIFKIPEFLLGYADPIFEFNRRIIDATKDIVCGYKMNLAFYEVIGEHGWYTIHQTLARIPENLITIGDAKRNDIGNSVERYAKLLLEDYEFSAVTLNPYMGEDSITPFLKRRDQCAFILTLTSNDGAKDFQYLNVNGKPLYEKVIEKVKEWNKKSNCGLIVGATRPRELQRIRKLAPDLPILIPGIGMQGGDLWSAVRYGCDEQGELAILTASRAIIYAGKDEHFAEAAREKALKLRENINRFRETFFLKKQFF